MQAVDFETSVDQTVQAITLGETTPLEPTRRVSLTDKLKLIASEEGFDVQELLGRGGMGAVMLARDRGLGRMVALKFLALPAQADDKKLEGLRLEAERAGNLAHENVVQIYSWHSVGNLTFFAMEYIEGENLQQYVQREAKIAPEELLRIGAEAAQGLAAAHERGVMHRDIKPQNIMISTKGRVKVADFGLSSTALEERRRDGHRISGTLGFMAPEQARGEPGSFSSDVYGLAATLYYAFAKVSPYGPPKRSQDLLIRNQEGAHNPLAQVQPNLHPMIYQLIEKGMTRDVAQRFKSAEEFRRAIEHVLFKIHQKEEPKLSLREKLLGWLNWPSFITGLTIGVGVTGLISWAILEGLI
ncbi:MAG: serine/threonine-protein kinase [Sumerlaeia bacterium]